MPWSKQEKISLTPSLILWPAARQQTPNLNYRSAQFQSPDSQPRCSLFCVTLLLRGAEWRPKFLISTLISFPLVIFCFFSKKLWAEVRKPFFVLIISLLSKNSGLDTLFPLHVSYRLLETIRIIRVLFLPWSALGRKASLVNSDLCAF